MKEKHKWDDSHRLWPLPPTRWQMKQTWNDLLFTHYPIRLEDLRKLVPEVLSLDSFDGIGWIGIVSFQMTGIRLKGLPSIPRTNNFPQVNVRTYVNLDGKLGVYFLSLDAANSLAASVAKNFFNLPYYVADITLNNSGLDFVFNSKRRSKHQTGLECNYKPITEPYFALKGTFDEWMAERYCFYTLNRMGKLLRCDVLHQPWPLQHVEAEISQNTLLTKQGIKIEREKPIFHFSKRMEVRTWPLIPSKM